MRGSLMVGAGLVVVLAGWAARSHSGTGPRYTPDGALIRPDGIESWILVGASLGLGYGQAAGTPPGMFHRVYLEPSAYDRYRRTGRFPDGTMLALAVHLAAQRVPPASQGWLRRAGRPGDGRQGRGARRVELLRLRSGPGRRHGAGVPRRAMPGLPHRTRGPGQRLHPVLSHAPSPAALTFPVLRRVPRRGMLSPSDSDPTISASPIFRPPGADPVCAAGPPAKERDCR
jgi:hypothetical protein